MKKHSSRKWCFHLSQVYIVFKVDALRHHYDFVVPLAFYIRVRSSGIVMQLNLLVIQRTIMKG